jgi:hypothetical protein
MAASYPDGDGHIEPYAGFSYREPDGSQSLKAGGHPMPTAGDGYGTQDDPADDHSLSYGHAMRPTFAGDHERATAARTRRSEDKGDTKDPFDTVGGVPGSGPWRKPDPVYRRGSGTTQRP